MTQIIVTQFAIPNVVRQTHKDFKNYLEYEKERRTRELLIEFEKHAKPRTQYVLVFSEWEEDTSELKSNELSLYERGYATIKYYRQLSFKEI